MSKPLHAALALTVATAAIATTPTAAVAIEDPNAKKPYIQLVTKTDGYFNITWEAMPLDWQGSTDNARIVYPVGQQPDWSIMGTKIGNATLGVFSTPISVLGYDQNWFQWCCCWPSMMFWPNFHVQPEFRDVLAREADPRIAAALARADGANFKRNMWITGAWIGTIGGSLAPYAATGFNFNSGGTLQPMIAGGLGLVGLFVPIILSRWANNEANDAFADAVRAYNEHI